MTWLDVLLLALCVIAAVDGYRRGFIVHMADLLVLGPALVVTVVFWQDLADWLVLSHDVSPITARVVAPLSIFLVLHGSGSLVLCLLTRRISDGARSSSFNRCAGVAPAVVKTVVGTCLLLLVASAVPTPTVQTLLNGSSLTPPAVMLGRALTRLIGVSVEETVARAFRHPTSEEGEHEGPMKIPAITNDSKVRVETSSEEQMLYLVNRERTRAGLFPLVPDERLRGVAREKSRDMWHRGYFGHDDPDGKDAADHLRQAHIPFKFVGENIALSPSLRRAHDGLMESPGHRANILEPDYKHVGIGIILGGSQGLMVTQVFSN